LTSQSREEGFPCFLREERDDQPAQTFSNCSVLFFHGFIWWHNLVAEDAESDLGIQFKVLDERSLDDSNLPWFIW
jgi:hypothetical protein